MTQIHLIVGGLVLLDNLVAGIWALLAARRGATAPPALLIVGASAAGMLVLQVLLGLGLWSIGLRPVFSPTAGILNLVHIIGPVVALGLWAFAFFLEPRFSSRRIALAAWLTFLLALLSYGIGEMGNRIA
jgi:hypothetical protein